MKLLKNILTFLLFISSLEAYSATVGTVSQTTAITFGKLAPGTTTGTAKTDCTVTGTGVKSLGGCANGSFSITATNTSTANSGRRIMIFLNPNPTSLTGTPSGTLASTFSITSTVPTNCAVNSGGLQCTNPTSTNGNVRTWTIPVYGTLSSIATTQATGDYSGSYSLVVCSCCAGANSPVGCATSGCPTSATDTARCTNATYGKTFSSTIPARIVTGLTITENSALRFGAVAAGISSGTITESGTTTGGIKALTMGSYPRGAGQVTITGETGGTYNYTFTLPSTVTLSCDTGATASCSGAPNMTSTLAFASGTSSRTLVSGQDVVGINGTLTVGANQLSGNYKGTYTITVNY